MHKNIGNNAFLQDEYHVKVFQMIFKFHNTKAIRINNKPGTKNDSINNNINNAIERKQFIVAIRS